MIPDFQNASSEVSVGSSRSCSVVGLLLEIIALYCYAPLMKAALGDAGHDLSRGRLFRIQMSTRALSSIVPGGSAASSALGYRLMTLSGVSGPGCRVRPRHRRARLGGRAQPDPVVRAASCRSRSAGVNALYGSAALGGVIVMGLAAALVFGSDGGPGSVRTRHPWIARKIRMDEDKAAIVLHRVAERLEQLISDRQLLGRVAFWAALNWLFDAAALWVFLRAFNIDDGRRRD